MHEAAYQHYAMDYALLAAVAVVLFLALIAAAKIDGDRSRRRPVRVRASAPDSRERRGRATPEA